MNPYVWGPPPAAETPATALKTFGVLSLVFAALNALGNVAGVLQAALGASRLGSFGAGGAGSSPAVDAQLDAMKDYTMMAMKITAAEGGVMILMDVALFVIGIFLLQRREAGRRAAIGWSIAAFFVLAVRAALFEIFLWPRFARMLDGVGGSGAGGGGMFGMMTGFAHAGTYVSLCFMAIFPVVMLVVMNLASVKTTVKDPPDPPPPQFA